jgi:N utilization substance protein B
MANPSTGGGRRDARESALHLLYEASQRQVAVDVVIAESVLPPDDYTDAVLRGVEADRAELDERIGRLAEGWTIDRMPTMDRLVLELGLYELANRSDIPTAVVLNEAVELANRYSTDDSGRFVNGVLAAAARELRPTA